MSINARILFLSLVFCSLLSVCLPGQQTTATMSGTVTDSSGAAVSGVAIKVTNLATNQTREAQTDSAGGYSIPFLAAGDYLVTVTREGFQAQKIDTVNLQVNQSARVDFSLKIGNVAETVDVIASAVLLQTENATVGTVIDSSKIVELPLNGRNFIQLAQLIPGVQAGTPGSIRVRRGRGSVGQTDAAYGSTAASANGSRDTANRYFLDGIEMIMDRTKRFSSSTGNRATWPREPSASS